MKRILLTLSVILLTSSNCAFADGDLWDNFGDTNVYNQKAVTDEEFEKALKSKTEPKGFFKLFKRDKNVPRGEQLYDGNEGESEITISEDDEPSVVCIPLELKIDENKILPIGHYEVKGKMTDGKPYLWLYQGHYALAEIPAKLTKDDFGEKTVNFAKIMESGEKQIKLIYGSLDFNAYADIDIAQ